MAIAKSSGRIVKRPSHSVGHMALEAMEDRLLLSTPATITFPNAPISSTPLYVNQNGTAWLTGESIAYNGEINGYTAFWDSSGTMDFGTTGTTDTEVAYYRDNLGPDDGNCDDYNPPSNRNGYLYGEPVDSWQITGLAVAGYGNTTTGTYGLNVDGPDYIPASISLDASNYGSLAGENIGDEADADFYSFTTTTAGNWTVTVTPTGSLDPMLTIFDSSGNPVSPCTFTSPVDDGAGGGSETWTGYGLSSGTTYYLRVDGYYSSTGDFGITVQGPPPSDFPSAPLPGSTLLNTNQYGAAWLTSEWISYSGEVNGYTTFWDSPGSMNFNTTGSTDTEVAYYRYNSGIATAENDDYYGGDGNGYLYSQPVDGWQLTGLAVRGYGTTTGAYGMNVDGPDYGSTSIYIDPGTGYGSTSDYIYAQYDAAFSSFTTATSGNWTVTVTPTGSLDPQLTVFDNAGNPVGGSFTSPIDGYASGVSESWTGSGLSAGATYYVRVDGYDGYGTTGGFNVSVQGPPATDFPSAPLPSSALLYTNQNGDAWLPSESISYSGQVNGYTTFWDYSGSLNLNTTGTTDTEVAYYRYNSGTATAENDDYYPADMNGYLYSEPVDSWQLTGLAARGYSTATGPYGLNVDGPSYSSTSIYVNPTSGYGATSDYIYAQYDAAFSSFTTTVSGNWTVTVTPTGSLDPQLTIFDSSGNPVSPCTFTSPIDDWAGGGSETWTGYGLSAGATYYVRVDGYDYGGTTGGYNVSVQGPAALPDLYDDGGTYNGFSPSTAQSGQPWSAWMDVRNGGGMAAGSFWVDFYASSDSNINTSDYLLGSVQISGLSAGNWTDANLDLSSFPSGIPAGSYWVGAIIDADGQVTESNELNNVVAFDEGQTLVVAQPSISINDVTVLEGDPSGTTPFTFTVSLSQTSAQTVTVNYATANGTATAGSDYTAASGTLTFSPGQTSQQFTVQVARDSYLENDEVFYVNLSSPSNATIADSQGAGTIQNDDFPGIQIPDLTTFEGNTGTTPFVFLVTMDQASPQTVTVNYSTANGTATAGSDYTAVSGTLIFGPGQTSAPITVQVIGDTVTEPDETFYVNLSSVSSNATIVRSQATGTIQNDENPGITINDVTAQEGNSGTTAFTFNVALSQTSSQTVTVNYTTADGTASVGSDYAATSGTLTFTPGQTSKQVTVNVTGDTTVENDEVFYVNLSGASNALIVDADSRGIGTIQNDDFPKISINDPPAVLEGNSGTTPLVFTVTLDQASAQTVTVNYATADGTATAGADYTATNGTLTFTPGQTSKQVTVQVIGDTANESNETLYVNLTSPSSNATILDGQGVGTIQDDDNSEITVRGNGQTIADGDSSPSTTDSTDLGVTGQGGPALTATFTVANTGSALLTLGTPVLPSYYAMDPDDPLVTSLAAGQSDTFTVMLGTGTAGTFGGEISIATNDSDRNPFNFAVTGLIHGHGIYLDGSILRVVGNDFAEKIQIKKGSVVGVVNVSYSCSLTRERWTQSYYPGQVTRIEVFGLGGNDTISSAQDRRAATLPFVVYGGTGNDKITGDRGNDTLFGEDGDDTIKGGDGNDIIVGGTGRDTLSGGNGDDILFGSASRYDRKRESIKGENGNDVLVSGTYNRENRGDTLLKLLAEWIRWDASYSTKISNLTNGTGLNAPSVLSGTTVADDFVGSQLDGGKGMDWYLLGTQDLVKKLEAGEVITTEH